MGRCVVERGVSLAAMGVDAPRAGPDQEGESLGVTVARGEMGSSARLGILEERRGTCHR